MAFLTWSPRLVPPINLIFAFFNKKNSNYWKVLHIDRNYIYYIFQTRLIDFHNLIKISCSDTLPLSNIQPIKLWLANYTGKFYANIRKLPEKRIVLQQVHTIVRFRFSRHLQTPLKGFKYLIIYNVTLFSLIHLPVITKYNLDWYWNVMTVFCNR